MRKRHKKFPGFVLLEVMLATMIFGLAVVALARALNHTLDAAIEAQHETAIRLRLESQLAEARQQRLQPGRQTSAPDPSGVVYEREISPLEMRNAKGQWL